VATSRPSSLDIIQCHSVNKFNLLFHAYNLRSICTPVVARKQAFRSQNGSVLIRSEVTIRWMKCYHNAGAPYVMWPQWLSSPFYTFAFYMSIDHRSRAQIDLFLTVANTNDWDPSRDLFAYVLVSITAREATISWPFTRKTDKHVSTALLTCINKLTPQLYACEARAADVAPPII